MLIGTKNIFDFFIYKFKQGTTRTNIRNPCKVEICTQPF